ncbi:RimK family protein [Inquilinus sp. CAU 1745]|uniref:RimK family protein n=1 Tax=Inquilinus sp. CAU 1745 TaxID=3140369 RepID=UPI00325BB1CE
MNGWVIVVDRRSDFTGSEQGRTVATTREYIAGARTNGNGRPGNSKAGGVTPKIINLSRNHAYLSTGYYCSLLAEARGHRVIPAVETILELRQKSLYGYALPDLEEDLNRRVKRLSQPPEGPFKLLICFGDADDPRFSAFGRRAFDWFRAPILEVKVRFGEWFRITGIRPVSITDLDEDQMAQFHAALDRYTRRSWQEPRSKTPAKYTLAVLQNPKEGMAPSGAKAFQRLTRVAEAMGVDVELIGKKDYLRLAEYDALFIRETTAIDDHTYRFAKRAEQEGMPVMDDPTSILRCTNKVYLAELLRAHNVPTPRTVIVDSLKNIERLEGEIAYPIVLKIPDGSFSRGVYKAKDRRELNQMAEALLEDSDVILAQEYMYTEYDWRVGVLDGEPLFVCQYLMAAKHWQIVKHMGDGKYDEGRFKTFAVDDAPREVVEVAVKAARLIGDGLYGVDLKQNDRGVFVIEINDNPNLDANIEDAVLKDELWRRIVRWYLKRLEA